LIKIEEFLKIGIIADENDSILPYEVELEYSHEQLYTQLNDMIKLIHDIQIETAKRREVFVSNEI